MPFLLLTVLLLHTTAHIDAQAQAAALRLRDEAVQSAALGRIMKYRVLLPEDYDTSQLRYPVLYLTDLQADVAGKFRTINSRYGRAVAGLSMGGYGAIKMALKRPGAFGVAASFSGAFGATRDGELEPLISNRTEVHGNGDTQLCHK